MAVPVALSTSKLAPSRRGGFLADCPEPSNKVIWGVTGSGRPRPRGARQQTRAPCQADRRRQPKANDTVGNFDGYLLTQAAGRVEAAPDADAQDHRDP